jgi:bifunctional DNA-binding transcriptional regulator/antitoxin component of YhaV-PrlF toxin-antitoxin module
LNKLFNNPSSESFFEFSSLYGQRELPIDGLFIDAPQESRRQKVKEWIGEVLLNMPVDSEIIKKSLQNSSLLFNTYLNCFEDRITLSDYTFRKPTLNADELKYLPELNKRLGIDRKTGLIATDNEFSVQILLSKEKDKFLKRLTVLMTVTRAAIRLQQQLVESEYSDRYPPLTSWEYFNILFPKVNLKGKILLPAHCSSETEKRDITDTERKWLFRNLSIEDYEVTEANQFQFSQWISKAEKEVLKSVFYEDLAYFPDWLQ